MINNKIIILSDNHGKVSTMKNILDKFYINGDIVLHAGDILINKTALDSRFSYVVAGNNDWESYPSTERFSCNKKIFILCHGNNFFDFGGYKPNYDKLVNFMKQNNIDIFVHGHLHIPICKYYKNKLFLCPGSTDYPRNIIGATFMILYIYDHLYQILVFLVKDFTLIQSFDFNYE